MQRCVTFPHLYLCFSRVSAAELQSCVMSKRNRPAAKNLKHKPHQQAAFLKKPNLGVNVSASFRGGGLNHTGDDSALTYDGEGHISRSSGSAVSCHADVMDGEKPRTDVTGISSSSSWS